MFTNPFAEISGLISPEAMQVYVVLMVLLVIGGTLLDVMHKKSAKYFFENAKKAQESASRSLSKAEKNGLLVKTITNEVLTSSEFKNKKRRMSHLMTMYGFIVFVISTAVMIFAYPGSESASIFPLLWHLGALSLAVGGYWFWFGIRADVSAEGHPWYRIASWKGDIFILSLLAMSTFALLWSFTGSMFFFVLFIVSSTVLFSTILWSKFAHMFFKPAAAYQKKVIWADGSRENLPEIPDLSDPATHERFPDVPEYMGTNPADMGKGIDREPVGHY